MQIIEELAHELSAQNLTITCAESCTGGLLMHELTNIPGSSAYFVGGVVAYSNTMKHVLLGVQEEVLEDFGAVSKEAAEAMARGVRGIIGANMAIAITGIAGPNGGTDEKPVGLTYIALVTGDESIVERFVWDGNREENKCSSVEAAVQLALKYLRGNT